MSIDRSKNDKNLKNENTVEESKKPGSDKTFKNNLVIYGDAKRSILGQKKHNDRHNLKYSNSKENSNKNGASTYGCTYSENPKKVKFSTQTEVLTNDLRVFKSPGEINGSSTNNMTLDHKLNGIGDTKRRKGVAGKTNDGKNIKTDGLSDMTNTNPNNSSTHVSRIYEGDTCGKDMTRRAKQIVIAH